VAIDFNQDGKGNKGDNVQMVNGQRCTCKRWTFAELLDLVHTRPSNAHNARWWADDIKTADNDPKWVGGFNSKQLLAMTEWPEGRKIAEQYSVELANLPVAESIRRVRRWGEHGDEFSRDRFDAGYSDCWQTRKRQSQPTIGSGILKITCEISANSLTQARDMIWSGAAMCVLIDALEDAGYRCEVELICYGTYFQHSGSCLDRLDIVHVKNTDEPLDIDRLLFCLACPGFARFHMFRAFRSRDCDVSFSLGRFTDLPRGLGIEGEISMRQCRSLDDARCELQKIADQLAAEPESAGV
jgi:hypothetical protein